MSTVLQHGMEELGSALAERIARSRGPLKDRLLDAFTEMIDLGGLRSGEPLPAERVLASQLSVSRTTLRHCLKDLAQLGLVATRQGAGTVVVRRIPKALTRLSGFTEDMRCRGLVPSAVVLERRIAAATSDLAFRTGVPLGAPVLTLLRLRAAGGEVLALERALVPVDVVGEDFDGTTSLYERMDQHGARPVRVLQSLEAQGASADIADHLGIEPGAAVLKIEQIGYDRHGRAVEDAVTWYRGDRYRYVGEIRG